MEVNASNHEAGMVLGNMHAPIFDWQEGHSSRGVPVTPLLPAAIDLSVGMRNLLVRGKKPLVVFGIGC